MSAPSRPGPDELQSTWPQRLWTLAGTAAIVSSFLTCIRLLASSSSTATDLLAAAAAAFAAYSLADLALSHRGTGTMQRSTFRERAFGTGTRERNRSHSVKIASKTSFPFPVRRSSIRRSGNSGDYDLATGVYHWLIDNYGDASTPVLGPKIAAFQGHHRYPSTIALREPCNNLHALARAVAFVLVPADAALSDSGSAPAAAHAFLCAFAASFVLSQQFHAWAHEGRRRRQLPPGVEALQAAGVLVSRAQHAAHHRQPYNTNYCIVSGMWNGVLDKYKVFKAMEMVIFFCIGVRPWSWNETDASWKEDTAAEEAAAGEGSGGDGFLKTTASISSD